MPALIAIVEVAVAFAQRQLKLLYRLVNNLQAVLHGGEPKPIAQRSPGRCPFGSSSTSISAGSVSIAPFPQPIDWPTAVAYGGCKVM